MDSFILAMAIMACAGIFITWRYGKHQYSEGLIDAVQMHESGQLKYTTYMEDGQKMFEIEVIADEE